MKRLSLALLSRIMVPLFFGLPLNSYSAEWDTMLPKGVEGDVIEYTFKGLVPKASGIDGIFKVTSTYPGGRSSYVLKTGGTYYLLTKGNFVRLFAPIGDKAEVVPYVTAYERVFGTPYSSVITEMPQPKPEPEPEQKQKGRSPVPAKSLSDPKSPPPALTSVTTRKAGGFTVRLITYHALAHAYYAEKKLLVKADGTVEVIQKERIIKDLGDGVMVDFE